MDGGKDLHRRMKDAQKRIPTALERAVYAEALLVEQVSRSLTPVLTGALRASHVTGLPETSGGEITVSITVGGPAAPYAVFVHERLDLHHTNGQAKFLETAVLAAAPGFADRVARRIDLEGAMR